MCIAIIETATALLLPTEDTDQQLAAATPLCDNLEQLVSSSSSSSSPATFTVGTVYTTQIHNIVSHIVATLKTYINGAATYLAS